MLNTPIFETHGVIGLGYEGMNIDSFIEKVQKEQVSLLVDVRLNPISRKPGLSKTKLAANLKSIGVSYIHAPALGNPKWNRPGFSGNGNELRKSRSAYSEIITSDESSEWINSIAKEASNKVVALMCFEGDEDHCHRYVTLREIRKRMEQLAFI